jgi:hypothetical protein
MVDAHASANDCQKNQPGGKSGDVFEVMRSES